MHIPTRTSNGLGGDDTICGGEGQDYIDGGADDDKINGQGHTDFLHGNEGDDVIYGGPNPPGSGLVEVLIGEAGRDDLFGESGPDALWCDVDDDIDGGTGMGNGAPESDFTVSPALCNSTVNVP